MCGLIGMAEAAPASSSSASHAAAAHQKDFQLHGKFLIHRRDLLIERRCEHVLPGARAGTDHFRIAVLILSAYILYDISQIGMAAN